MSRGGAGNSGSLLFCGHDGWCHLTAIIDCFDRTMVGWRLSGSGIANVAAAALEDALRSRKINMERLWLEGGGS
jgi:transposase InsO family protein